MISKQLTTIKNLLNNNVTKSSNNIQQFPHISIDTRTQCDEHLTSISTVTDHISLIPTNPSAPLPWRLYPQWKEQKHHREKFILNENNRNLILRQHSIHRSISTSDCIDWNNHKSPTSPINNRLDAIDFLQEYLQSEKKDILIDLLYQIAHEINFENRLEKTYSHSAVNNNHFHVTPTWNRNLQLSNNKDKKNKNEKSNDQEKKDSNEKKSKKEDKKKEIDDNQAVSKKPKKESKKVEETISTTTTDSENIVYSPIGVNPTREYPKSSRSPSYCPAESLAFSTLSIPIPQSGASYASGLSTPDPPRVYISHQSNIAHLSQVQHQLQTDPQNSSSNGITNLQDVSVQQQLQSLSEMARDGEEILITLNVNALNQKQQINQNNTATPVQNNPYSFPSWNQMIRSSTVTSMPRHLEIVAKGFARVKNEHAQPISSHSYVQQQPPNISVPLNFVPQYPILCHSGAGPPQMPIGPPIQPIFPAPNITTSNGYSRSPSYGSDFRNPPQMHSGKCDYLCQSSFNEPDFRGRPYPGVTINPYFLNPSPPAPMNYSAKSSSKHRRKYSSKKPPSHHINFENISRTCSSIH